ncbi:32841_t:CDS:2 [Gigaspora margarita]|uniref:32841_t:CDS:1 n=1 Tax=Gigaspora margarita TaxID=4874 RepID=A0ABN7UMA5_GIGMA|nr:32841_t:CDS:2 [Gigaspora margarita]
MGALNAAEANSSITLCIIQAKFITLFSYPLQLLPAILAINLWFAVVRSDVRIEKKSFWWVTGFIWGWTILYNIICLILDSKETNSNVSATEFFCVQSSRIIWTWQSRNTAIKLGIAGRLVVLSCIYLISLIISVLSALMKYLSKKTSGWLTVADFSSCLIGTTIFLIFGTTKSAAVFLPCCYYVPPNAPHSQEQSGLSHDEVNPSFQLQIIGANRNQLQIPSRSPKRHQGTDDITDMNILIPDSPGGESSFLTNSSQNIVLEDLPPLSPTSLPSPTIPLQTRDDFRMHELQRDGYSNSGQFFDDWYKMQ